MNNYITPWIKAITVGNLGKHYKNIQKTARRKVKSINYEAKKFVEKPSIDDRV